MQSRYYDPETGRFINADGYVSTGQGLTGTNMFAYCGNNPVNRADPSGTSWQSVIKEFVQTAVEVVSKTLSSASKNAFVKSASLTKPASYLAGGVYRAIPNGLADKYTAMGNTLSTASKAFKAIGVGLLVADCGISIYSNFNNDKLTTSRKISDSVVDVGIAVGTFWGAGAAGAAIGTAIPIPGIGTAVGFGIGLGVGYIVESTPVVGWVKDGVGAAVNGIGAAASAVGGFFGGLFG